MNNDPSMKSVISIVMSHYHSGFPFGRVPLLKTRGIGDGTRVIIGLVGWCIGMYALVLLFGLITGIHCMSISTIFQLKDIPKKMWVHPKVETVFLQLKLQW